MKTGYKLIFLVLCLICLNLISFFLINSLNSYAITQDHTYEFKNANLTTMNGTYTNWNNIRINPDGNEEVSRWEFALASPDTLNAIGADDPNNWNDLETGDVVNIAADETNDREVYCYSASVRNGIQKSDFMSEPYNMVDDKQFNFSTGFTWSVSEATIRGRCEWLMTANDSSTYININFRFDVTTTTWEIAYHDGSTWNVIQSGAGWLDSQTPNTVNIDVNYLTEMCYLGYFNGSVWLNKSFSTSYAGGAATNIGGLESITTSIRTYNSVQNIPYHIDWIQILDEDGYSISDEWAWKSMRIYSTWNMEHYNLITYKIGGGYIPYGMVNYTDGAYEIGVTSLEDLFKKQIWDNTLTTYNCYTTGDTLTIPYLIFYQENYLYDVATWFDVRGMNVNNLSIDGVYTSDTGTVWLEYDYSSGYTDPFTNYFYVNTTTNSTNLYYTLTTSNSNLEYIEATFDIANVQSVNGQFGFTGIDTGYPFSFTEGAVYCTYSDATANEFLFTNLITYNTILPDDKLITKFSVLVTDNDQDEASGNINTGYITEIDLKYYLDSSLSLTIGDIVDMLLPLIALIIPPLFITGLISTAGREGRHYSKLAFAPLILLMDIILIATGTIELWLFFTIAVAMGGIIFLQNRRKKTEE